MIVYTGKQFWNDFNNGDEALFQDANRPRDNDKFKIRPWLQSDKWKQREVNKDITVESAQLAAVWTTENVSAAYNLPEDSTISKLSVSVKEWNPWCVINKDWHIEIVEDGTYIVQAFTQFFPSTTPSSSYNYIEKVGLLVHKTWNYTWFERTLRSLDQTRMCGSGDELMARWAGWFTKWTVINAWAIHTYTSPMRLKKRVNVQRLA